MLEFLYFGDKPFAYGEWFQIESESTWRLEKAAKADNILIITNSSGVKTTPRYEMELEDLLANSKLFGEQGGVLTLAETLQRLDFHQNVKDLISESSLVDDTPKVPRGQRLTIQFLDKPRRIQNGALLEPMTAEEIQLVEKSLHYTGAKKLPKSATFSVCKSVESSTCLLRVNDPRSIDMKPTIIINFNQLRALNHGQVTVSFLAQVITHEYAHLVYNGGIIKNSQHEKFKRQLAARKLHHDQFNHPGYSYPWYEEAWAILCEYMVHGHSVRGLTTVEGFEIAAEYFDSNYILNGQAIGTPMKNI